MFFVRKPFVLFKGGLFSFFSIKKLLSLPPGCIYSQEILIKQLGSKELAMQVLFGGRNGSVLVGFAAHPCRFKARPWLLFLPCQHTQCSPLCVSESRGFSEVRKCYLQSLQAWMGSFAARHGCVMRQGFAPCPSGMGESHFWNHLVQAVVVLGGIPG